MERYLNENKLHGGTHVLGSNDKYFIPSIASSLVVVTVLSVASSPSITSLSSVVLRCPLPKSSRTGPAAISKMCVIAFWREKREGIPDDHYAVSLSRIRRCET